MKRKEKLVRRLRRELNLSEITISDSNLLKITKNTFLYARINLSIELDQFGKTIKKFLKQKGCAK